MHLSRKTYFNNCTHKVQYTNFKLSKAGNCSKINQEYGENSEIFANYCPK